VFVPQITRVAGERYDRRAQHGFRRGCARSGAGPFTIMGVHMLGNVLDRSSSTPPA